jgi:hypothetical protein
MRRYPLISLTAVCALTLGASCRDAAAPYQASAPPVLVAALTNAHGRSGYYDVRHLEGRLGLDAYRRATAGRSVPRSHLVQLQLQAGDSAAGFASLDSAVHERADWLYRIPCFAQLDEYRATPRYRALLARIGEMPAR